MINNEESKLLEYVIGNVRNRIHLEGEQIDDDKLYNIIEIECFDADLTIRKTRHWVNKIFAKLRYKLGILEDLVKDDSINEIMVNGPNNIFIERGGCIEKLDRHFDSTEELEDVIRKIVAEVHREINELNPIVDARLSNGSRVNAVYKNIAIDGPTLTIRKFAKSKITLEEMVESGSLSNECCNFLKSMVYYGYNIFISGGTSSGKTTFLNALSDYIPREERVIVIEDSLELQINNIDNIVRMECKNANSMGKGSIEMDSLIKSSLRMRPDRIVVGEVRGKEVFQMIQAMNTGHKGSLSTGHGNSVGGMLRRLESMYLMAYPIPIDAIRVQIVEAIDIMVHLERTSTGKRMVVEVVELISYKNGEYETNAIFKINENLELKSTGNSLINRAYLRMRGVEKIEGL